MIFREQLCPQLIKLKGLFRHALIRPDQVDIWDQVPPCAYWNDQEKSVYFAETTACPKRQAVFLRVSMSHAQARQMTADGLDAYGECRDSERTKFSNLSAGVIAKKRGEIADETVFTRSQ